MKAKCYDKAFKYTPVAEQGEGYLRKKFEAMQRAQKKALAPKPSSNVSTLPYAVRKA